MGDSDNTNSLTAVLSATHIRRMPEDIALVVRTMVLLNGLSHRLAPGRRLIQSELLKHLAAGAARVTPALRTAEDSHTSAQTPGGFAVRA